MRVIAALRRTLFFAAFGFGGACGTSPNPAPAPIVMAAGAGVVSASSAGAIAAADQAARQFAVADVEFMQRMIPHHAQAVIMARWAPTHGARADIRILCERIAIAQADEIRLMRRWLAERNQVVPDSMETHHQMKMGETMPGMAMGDMAMGGGLMPGMLTDEQMAALDKARGSAFDRLFLIGMIGHHMGALDMVHELFRHGDAGHDETVFRFASDVEADQSAELNKMQRMLETVP